jgi:thymidylate synthase (FAD)
VEFRSKGSVSLQDYMGDDCTIVNAARVSFARNGPLEVGDAERGLIRFLLENRHGTPFEHVTFTFLVECPIFVAREWFRHRIGSFNEVSGRYSELAPVFWVPDTPRAQRGKAGAYHFAPIDDPEVRARTFITLKALYGLAWQAYEAILSDGVAKEVARTVLPVGTFTRFYWTVNLRSLFNFLSLRNAPQAQAEIRELAQDVETLVSHRLPETMAAWREAGGTAV